MNVLLEQISEGSQFQIGNLSPITVNAPDPFVETSQDHVTGDTALCAHQLLEQQVERTPAAIALITTGSSLSYRELNERANQLAHYLREQGVGLESLVGICLERSFEMIVSMLAVLKAGGAYVPLDPTYPLDRLRFMIDYAALQILLSQQSLVDRLPVNSATVICLDAHRDEISQQPKENLRIEVTEKNLAYMIYTSGSTGKPKGVLVQHGGVCNLARAQAEAFEVRPDSRVLQFASMSFDASVSEVFKTLSVGAQLYLETRNRVFSGPDLSRLLREQEITIVTLPPTALLTLKDQDLPALRTLVVAGEACPPELVARWSPGRLFLNAYGPTEITVCATIASCSETTVRPPIGRPMHNTQVYVLDSNLQIMPPGKAGELYLGGVGIARGYHNRPELTAEKFLPNPFSDQPGMRLYRTGDWGRYLIDGQLEFLGRIDDQVKVRGFRIELGEIETELRSHPAVKACVVVARESSPGQTQLIAYLVGTSKTALESASLSSYLKERLPEYMVPTSFVELETLPLSPNGKIDRQALPAPSLAATQAPTASEVPRTPLEKLVARLWCEILPIETARLSDNFFDVGGDSLRAALLLNRLHDELGEVVYVVALFDAPTLSGLCSYLNEHYPRAIARLTGEDLPGEDQSGTKKVEAATLDYVRQLIKPLPKANFSLEPKNPSAIFILSPPRSGSTLLRVMLAGHPELFAPPELQLLCANTLKDRKAIFTGRYSFWLEGTIRALMDIKDCDAETAKSVMKECEDRGMTAQDFYFFMQELIDPRKLVDKTPAYALDLETLKRAEDSFDEPLYIHLLRHPYGMIRSFEDAKLDQIFRYEHTLKTRELAECIWTICHQNITQFLHDIPANRQHVVEFETLTTHPRTVLQELCGFLGIGFEEAMLQPHAEQEKKMTDGIHGLSRMLGDIKFHTHKTVDATIASRWKKDHAGDFLGDVTWAMAQSLGYSKDPKPDVPASSRVVPPLKALSRKRRTGNAQSSS